VTSTLAQPIRVGNADKQGRCKFSKGRALPVASARLRIWNGERTYYDRKQPVDPDGDGSVFTVTGLPAGPAMVQSWFYDDAGNELCGAYYIYTRRQGTTTQGTHRRMR